MSQRPISSWANRSFQTGKRQRHQVIYSLVLALFLLAGLLGNWAFAVPAAQAASISKHPLPAAVPGKLTFKQFMQLTQGKHAKVSGPTKAQAPADPYSKYEHFADYSKLPPSAEPPTMQPIHATLSSAFLAGGQRSPAGSAGCSGQL